MTKSVCFLLLSSLTLIVWGQAPTDIFEKAPPGVDDALRARVNGLYQTWVDGKFRAGEKFVAEDAQETYYSMQKQKFGGCEIIRLKYARDFNDAIVTVSCKGKWSIQGKELDSVLAHTDFWTLEKGLWVWTLKPITKVETPFGTSNYGDIDKDKTLFNPETGIPKDFNAVGAAILQQVTVDKQSIQLSSFEKASAVVTIRNGINGFVDVSATSSFSPPGFSLTFDKSKIPAKGEARLTIAYDPRNDKSAKPTMTVVVTVEQTSRRYPIEVTFAIPDETQKLIEKSKTSK